MKLDPLRFVVHEHHAKRLHYDFRLEIDGALKSWAVPKGPSLNPKDRRLAIQVPDHVLEYIDFQGIIPEGRSGAGPVIIWDAGTFAPLDTDDPGRTLDGGKLRFILHGRKLKGEFVLARMQGLPKGTGKEWLLMKKQDAQADPGFTLAPALTPAKRKGLHERLPPCATE